MIRRSYVFVLLFMLASIMAACGGGGSTSSGIGGTGITSSGAITGTGSIYVNGVRFNTDNATVTVNDGPATASALKVGMVVKVVGTVDDGGVTGTANTVDYDNEIKGPVTGLNTPASGDGLIKQFTVMGQVVEISSTATMFENEGSGPFDFETIMDNDFVEVSGFVDQAGVLQATRVEKKTGSEVELKGTVANYSPTGGAAGMGSFTLGTLITVEVDAGTDTSDLSGGLANDLRVEVKGSLAGTIITATEIEPDDSGLGDDVDNVSLEGIVSGFTDINSSFTVAGQTVDASTASLEPANLVLGDGVQVEVEGDIVNGVLVADEVEARSGEVKLHATVSSTTTSSITLRYIGGNVTAQVDNQTSFKDGLTLQSIAQNDFLKIEGYQDGLGNVIASEVKRESSVDNDVMQGPVDAPISQTGGSITVLGIRYTLLDGVTSYADASETSIDNAAFFSMLNVGDTVKIVDDVPTDGTADEVEFE